MRLLGGLARVGFKWPCNWDLPDSLPRAVTNSSPETTNPRTTCQSSWISERWTFPERPYTNRTTFQARHSDEKRLPLRISFPIRFLLRCKFEQGDLLQLLLASEKIPRSACCVTRMLLAHIVILYRSLCGVICGSEKRRGNIVAVIMRMLVEVWRSGQDPDR